ncbi:MAG: S8 family serine peptidase [Micromonosporaceae bacterium]
MAVLVSASPAHADVWRDRQWHLDFLKVAEIHKITKGRGAIVAVVDTGVDGNHPDLKGNVLKGIDILAPGANGWNDPVGHGTAMASLIAGHGHGQGGMDGVLGVAPEAKVLPIRLIKGGEPTISHDRSGIAALDRAAYSDASVINLSALVGGTISEVETALAQGKVVVAAAGNSVDESDVIQPANYPGVVAVSGLDRDGNFTNASVEGPEVVLSAPAVDIAAAGAGSRGRYATGTGTSSATALVSATAALIKAKYPDLSANGVINRLIKTADDKGPPGRDPKYGFGVVNPLKALTADIPDLDYNPLVGPGKKTKRPQLSAPSSTTAKANPNGDSSLAAVSRILLPALAITAAVTVAVAIPTLLIIRRRRSKPGLRRDR